MLSRRGISRAEKDHILATKQVEIEAMKIELKCSCGEQNCKEWAIIELQGVVEAQPPFQDCLPNLEIGRLCRPSSQESYTLTVGYHELVGSKVPLKKPYLVLKKIKYMDVDGSSRTDSPRVELDVIGIIRHRILFKTRPKALIPSSQPVAKEKTSKSSALTPTQT